jgi:chromosome transmission fidelity protein 18
MFCLAKSDLAEVVGPQAKKRGHDQVEEPKQIVVERVKKDFFGRAIVEEMIDDGKRRRTDSNNALKIQPNVWVRFNEGYSNAVRKPVAFAELLGRM